MLPTLFREIQFEWPLVLWLLALLPGAWWVYFRQRKRRLPAIKITAIPATPPPFSLVVWLKNLPDLCKWVAVVFLIIAIAGPVRYQTIELNKGKGIEVILCLDVSGSMLAQDFEPNRLQASLEVAQQFVQKRKGDRIGLVVFAGQSLTLCPLTTDHKALLDQLKSITYGMLTDGTSIGSGLASAVDRLRSGQSPSKVIVLLTDGEDTGGRMDPLTAKNIAQTYGVKVYTIGVGTEGYAQIPYKTPTGSTVLEKEKVSIDEKLLQQIAGDTGGKYYRARNSGDLLRIYADIDKLEKSDIRTSVFNKKTDAFFPFVTIALVLLVVQWILAQTWLRRFP